LDSNTKCLIAMTVAVILVAGAFALPPTFNEQSYAKKGVWQKSTKETKKGKIEDKASNRGAGGARNWKLLNDEQLE
jgi:hypothetical protein